MRLEFTYELADLREARIPERFAINPAKYARRWLVSVLSWGAIAAACGCYLWIDHVEGAALAGAHRPVPRLVRHFRGDLLPALCPAFVLYTIFLLRAVSLWRQSRERRTGNTITKGQPRRLAGIVIGVLIGFVVWAALDWGMDFTWRPTATENALIIAAPWLALFGVMQVLGYVQQRAQILVAWRHNPALQRRKTVTIDEASFRIRDALSDLSLGWPYFNRVRETANLLLLIDYGDARYAIPKRAFSGPAELEQCRSLLQNVVPNTRFLVKPIGFAVVPVPVLPLPGIPPQASPTPSLTPQQEAGTMPLAKKTELQQ